MGISRLVLPSVLISLPAFALVGAGIYFLVDKAPRVVSRQRASLTADYRLMAEELLKTGGGERIERPKGWRQRGRLDDADDRKVPWGYQVEGPRAIVWIAPARGFVRARTVGRIDFFDVEPWLDFGIPAILAFFVLMTLACLRMLIRETIGRDRFIAATAHDLTTPLVGLRRTIGRDDAEAKRLAEQMACLVENLKIFLRMGGRTPRPHLEVLDLVALYRAAYGLFRDDFRDLSDGLDVAVEESSGEGAPSDGSFSVLADVGMSRQILWNLLSNELKYAAPFGRVSVRFSREGPFVRLDFTDEGPGLSPRDRRRVFRRHYRAKGAVASGKGGFGIGLATAYACARAMGGDLRVSARAPHGCVFSLFLRWKCFRNQQPTIQQPANTDGTVL